MIDQNDLPSPLQRALAAGHLTMEGDKAFLNFNKIEVQQVSPWSLQVRYIYVEPGEKIGLCVQQMDVPVNLAGGQILTLQGIVGKMGVEIRAN